MPRDAAWKCKKDVKGRTKGGQNLQRSNGRGLQIRDESLPEREGLRDFIVFSTTPPKIRGESFPEREGCNDEVFYQKVFEEICDLPSRRIRMRLSIEPRVTTCETNRPFSWQNEVIGYVLTLLRIN